MLQDAKHIVNIFNTFIPDSAAIAGGCLRDMFTDRTPKDVDIIVEYKDERDYKECEILADRLGYTTQWYAGSGLNSIPNVEDPIIQVCTLSKVGKLPIDMIFMECSIREAVKNFPCNAVKVYLAGDACKPHPEFTEFLQTRKLKFASTAREEYKARLLSYYPQEDICP